ncbi:MAG: extracellular solute-binding protein [Alphaproteobacteria bacterium]|nr:extracellular solute-binding protein [Alphaproteobacteria bacterium]
MIAFARLQKGALAAGTVLAFLLFFSSSACAQTSYGLALHGELKYPASFRHFDYVNPDAPKGGILHLSALGSFDTLNPFTLKGIAADGVGLVFETLMARSQDEPFSQYGWIAQTVTVAPDNTWVSYILRPEARFQDGSPITPEDVVFSFETLRDKGHPLYRSYYKDVTHVSKTGPREVRFSFRNGDNAELSLILGELPILSKNDWAGKDFSATTLTPPLGSGPYKIGKVVPGRSITLVRNKTWWAANLPINKGRFNFDALTYDYYRDTTVATEAFFAGRYDYRYENIAKNWALEYNTPAVRNGLIKKQVLEDALPVGMQAFIFNIRRPIFRDRRVREALNDAFDFEWANKNLAYSAYQRTESYFENSELAAKGLPSADEQALLAPFRDGLPADLFTTPFSLPKTDGSGNNRANLRRAAALLREAGWTLKNGVLVNKDGKPFTFEILEAQPAFERWVQPFLRNLERLGIHATFRLADSVQVQNRMDSFDFDMTSTVFGQSLSPGNEQTDMWGSAKAQQRGSRNLIGIQNPVVDSLIGTLIHAKTRKDLITACHALDRVLLWQYYVIPHWYIGAYRIAYWDKFGQPAVAPPYGLAVIDTWWVDPQKAEAINRAQNR